MGFALVVGVEDYNGDGRVDPVGTQNEVVQDLPHSCADARLVGDALRRAGVTVTYLCNPNLDTLRRAIIRLSTQLQASERSRLGMLYYSGHGIEVDGDNYLIPSDFGTFPDQIASASAAARKRLMMLSAVSFNEISDLLEGARPGSLTVLAFDACRDNPFAKRLRGAYGAKGLATGGGYAPVHAPKGVLVSFATRPGAVAYAGPGPTSEYAQALARLIDAGGDRIIDQFIRLAGEVEVATKRQQQPTMYIDVEENGCVFHCDRLQSPPLLSSRSPSQLETLPSGPPPEARQSAESAKLQWVYPDWYQVLAKYPELQSVTGRGGPDLCSRCLVGQDGYLQLCAVAGPGARSPDIHQAAVKMMSMIRILNEDQTPAQGRSVIIPTNFGRLEPPPPGGYCQSYDQAEYLP